ncbi:hypothetical protein M427DRAFT_272687 [Gonapodya prolifera JEL478]|uniref:DH domain-containing protein n=1 Tax=Gonapodya prolifera (strain JEL478) TaxID=1344416 RepID=A0A139AXT6_GONPJ|nr:hypothetical protein M427DRAFT_272687 [Gonapodya prolifera JEL478]|eukprot:KXS21530.1 hypothetical protein M427DRAFT_272687 [Gonapodya prolifera JEL478]
MSGAGSRDSTDASKRNVTKLGSATPFSRASVVPSGSYLPNPSRAPAGFGSAAHSGANGDTTDSGFGGIGGVMQNGGSSGSGGVKGLARRFEASGGADGTRETAQARPFSMYAGGSSSFSTSREPPGKKASPAPRPKPPQLAGSKPAESVPGTSGQMNSYERGRARSSNPREFSEGNGDFEDSKRTKRPIVARKPSDDRVYPAITSRSKSIPNLGGGDGNVQVVPPVSSVPSVASRIQALQAGSGTTSTTSVPLTAPVLHLPSTSRPLSMISSTSTQSGGSSSNITRGRKPSPAPLRNDDLDISHGSGGPMGRPSRLGPSPPTINAVTLPSLPPPEPIPPLSIFGGGTADLSGTKAPITRNDTTPSVVSPSSVSPSLLCRTGTDSSDTAFRRPGSPSGGSQRSLARTPSPQPEEDEAEREEKQRKKRINVTNEVVETEEAFARDMGVLSDYFYTPSLSVLPPSNVLLIFSNLPALLSFSRHLLSLLRAARQNNAEGGQDLADIFVRSAADMEDVYE